MLWKMCSCDSSRTAEQMFVKWYKKPIEDHLNSLIFLFFILFSLMTFLSLCAMLFIRWMHAVDAWDYAHVKMPCISPSM